MAGPAAAPGCAELEDLVARFRAGEAEIAVQTFAQRRPRELHRRWLRFQIAREARNLEELTDHLLCRMAAAVEDTVSREDLIHRLTEDYQEVGHYAMLAYVYEGLTGEQVRWKPLRDEAKGAPWYEWSRREHARWAELREHGTPLQLAAALFTRGGGGALFYGLLQVGGTDYEALLAEAAKIILHDELEHGASEGRSDLYPLLRTDEDLRVAREIAAELSTIRLRMRNEQFGGVLSEERLQAIARGEIEPLTFDEMWQACATRVPDWYALYHASSKPLSAISVID